MNAVHNRSVNFIWKKQLSIMMFKNAQIKKYIKNFNSKDKNSKSKKKISLMRDVLYMS